MTRKTYRTDRTADGRTASEVYRAKRQEVDGLLADLKAALREEANRQRKDARNWGFVGNMEYVAEQLKELVRFTKGERQ